MISFLLPHQLMHFVKQDTSMFPNAKLRPERMVRLARHMLQQRSMYPLFPAPKKAQLDARLLEHASLHIRPDIILANSALRYFAKDVDGVAVVNPASLAKFATGGTYAKIYIAPTPKISASALATGIAGEEAPVAARTRVEIVRI
jgi:DNA polymerase alpha subunit B